MRLRYKQNLDERADACGNYFIDRNCPDSAVDAINNPNYVDFKALFDYAQNKYNVNTALIEVYNENILPDYKVENALDFLQNI